MSRAYEFFLFAIWKCYLLQETCCCNFGYINWHMEAPSEHEPPWKLECPDYLHLGKCLLDRWPNLLAPCQSPPPTQTDHGKPYVMQGFLVAPALGVHLPPPCALRKPILISESQCPVRGKRGYRGPLIEVWPWGRFLEALGVVSTLCDIIQDSHIGCIHSLCIY